MSERTYQSGNLRAKVARHRPALLNVNFHVYIFIVGSPWALSADQLGADFKTWADVEDFIKHEFRSRGGYECFRRVT